MSYSGLKKRAHSRETDAALSSTLAVASVGIATLKMLETLLPAAAQEIERESNALSLHFTTLLGSIRRTDLPPEIAQAIEGIIISMQFQDRNTQVMENVTGILERYRKMLQEINGNIERLRADHTATGQTISDALNGILSGIRLSDIRQRYVEALRMAQIHSAGVTDATPDPASHTVDIF